MSEVTLQDIAISNAVIHEKLDTILTTQQEIKDNVEKHELRISTVEHTISRVKGVLWTVSGLGTISAIVAGVWNDVFAKWFWH